MDNSNEQRIMDILNVVKFFEIDNPEKIQTYLENPRKEIVVTRPISLNVSNWDNYKEQFINERFKGEEYLNFTQPEIARFEKDTLNELEQIAEISENKQMPHKLVYLALIGRYRNYLNTLLPHNTEKSKPELPHNSEKTKLEFSHNHEKSKPETIETHSNNENTLRELKTIWLAEPKISVENFLAKRVEKGIWSEYYKITVKKGSVYSTGKTLLGSLSIALKGYAISEHTDYKVIGQAFCKAFNEPIKETTGNPYKAFSSGNQKVINELKKAYNIKI